MTRDLVGKINDQYGEGTLMMPKARIRDDVAKVPGLDGEKMSKSYNNTLPIFGDEKPTKKLIMRIKTDSERIVSGQFHAAAITVRTHLPVSQAPAEARF